MARAFNAKVRHREFNPGDLVLRKVLHVTPDSRGKFSYKYNGPFVVKETFFGGAIILSDMDGTENALPVNADAIKKSKTSPRRPRQKLGNEGQGLKSRKGESWQKESINHFLARSKTSPRRPRQKLGNEGQGLKSRKGESWQKESINHFLARSKTSPRRPRQKLGNEGQGLKSRKGESWQKESINHFLARSKTSPRRPRQKLGNEGQGLKSRKGESWQKESINHFLARSKTLKGQPRRNSEEPRGCLLLHAQVQSGTLKGISSLTNARLAHAAHRDLKPSGGPDKREKATSTFPTLWHFTAFHGFRPGNLLLSTGFGLAFYCFPRASAWPSTVFHGLRPGNLPLSTGFRLAIYCFPRASAWQSTAFHGLRPGILLVSTGFGLAIYRFPRASAWHFTAFHGLRPGILLLSTGFGLAIYCFPRASARQSTAFHGLRPGILPLSIGFGLGIYCFPQVSPWHFTAFHGLRHGNLLFSTGFGLAFYCFPWFSAWKSTTFHRLRPGILPLSTGFGLAFYYFPRALAWRFTAFHALRPGNLPLSTDFGLAIYRLPQASDLHILFCGLRPHHALFHSLYLSTMREAGSTRKAQEGSQKNRRTTNPKNRALEEASAEAGTATLFTAGSPEHQKTPFLTGLPGGLIHGLVNGTRKQACTHPRTTRTMEQVSDRPSGLVLVSREVPTAHPSPPYVPFPPTTSASRAITFKGSLTTLTLPREEAVTVREPYHRAQPPFHPFSLYRVHCFLPSFLSSFRVCPGLGTFRTIHERLDPSVRSPRNLILLGAVVGASVPSLIFLGCHERHLTGDSCLRRQAESSDSLCHFPDSFPRTPRLGKTSL
ncbi:hypothetical protein CRG98_012069 [Punica granatum]|uniref:Uncharacterized protein n=1 Tax=Punica granatum TaxID=22663 RepID=A0A2I0KG56_PUNGR|nr:hypothetical protein CRG98_012069 [Punica granatum]